MTIANWFTELDVSVQTILFCKRFDQHSPIWNLKRHSHACLELLFFLRGEATIDTEGQVLSTTAYDLVLYLPGHEHQETVDLRKHQEIICLWVDCSQPPLREGSLHLSDKQRTLEWLFIQLEKEHRGNSTFSAQLVCCYLRAIFQTIARQLMQGESENASDSLQLVQSYIGEHFTQRLSVAFLAGLCHVSPSYLHRIFRRQLGVSPTQYINDLRVREAEYLLNTADIPIVEVAERSGFEDPHYFSRLFNKKTGLSPSQYRAKCQKTRS